MAFERHYDVVVVGAGVAGVAAALQCARSGLHTALVEKTILLGGLATTGLVNVFLPLCDGLGHQVIFGIAEELLWASLRYGPGAVPAIWTGDAPRPEIGQPMPRLQAAFSPAAFALALDEVVLEAGVEPWLDTLVTHPLLEGDRVVGLQVENKSGRGVLYATCVVDATGDADVAARAGAPCVTGHNWLSLWALEHAHGAGLNMVRLGADAMGRGHPDNHPIYHGVGPGTQLPGHAAHYGAVPHHATRRGTRDPAGRCSELAASPCGGGDAGLAAGRSAAGGAVWGACAPPGARPAGCRALYRGRGRCLGGGPRHSHGSLT